MKLSPCFITGVSALVLLQSVHSLAEEEGEKKRSFSADAEVGIIQTTGNTETSSLKGRLDISKDFKNWKSQAIFETLYKEDELTDETTNESEKQTTAEQYFLSLRGDYKLNQEHKALFIYAEYDDKRFSSYEYQYSLSAGYADRLFTHDNSYFAYSIGPGYSVDKPKPEENEDGILVDGEEESSMVVFASIEYVYNFSDHAKFKQTVASTVPTDSDRNTKTKAVTSLTANINSSFAMKASYTVDYNSRVTSDTEHADTQTALTLVYSF